MERSCYKCQEMLLCFMRIDLDDLIRGRASNYLKVKHDEEPPLMFTSLFDALAQCCKKFKVNPDE